MPLSLTLVWNSVANASGYEYVFGIDSQFSSYIGSGTVTCISMRIELPAYTIQYFWRVRVRNSNQTSSWPEVLNFRTETLVSVVESNAILQVTPNPLVDIVRFSTYR